MTDPSLRSARAPVDRIPGGTVPAPPRRRLAALATAGLLGIGLPVAVDTSPAVAAPTDSLCATTGRLTATATADLFRLDRLDLRPLGERVEPVAGVRVASTRAETAGGPPAGSVAVAEYLPGGPPNGRPARASQVAPPAATAPVTAVATGTTLGVLALGPATLTAYTPWPHTPYCAARVGRAAEASAVLGTARTPAGRDLGSTAATGVVDVGGALRPEAAATAGLNDLTLFTGTPVEVRIRMLRAPSLRVVGARPAADATVEYTVPAVEVTLPGGGTRTLDAPAEHVEVTVPLGDGGGPNAAPPTPTAPTHPPAQSAAPAATPVPSGSATPTPSRSTASPATAAPPSGSATTATVRVSLGSLDRRVSGDLTRAQTTALRIQVDVGSAGGARTSAVDVGLGALDATAGVLADAGPGGALAITGSPVATLAGWGGALVLAGALLLYAARRRRPAPDGQVTT